jgi:hypothetical protein
MDKNSTATPEASLFDGTAWFDPIEAGVRERIRGFIEAMLEEELTVALGRTRYRRDGEAAAGYRHGVRHRQLLGSFGPLDITVPRGRMSKPEGGTAEWRSAALPRYARMTRQAEALIAATYLAGTNTRRVKRALGALFKGAVGKDVVSRTWRKVKADWENWTRRSLADEDIVRLILDGTVVKVRLDRRATNISLLVVLGVRHDGQKLLLAVRNMGGESEAAWRVVLDDLIARGLRTPELLLIDGGAGLERALASLWPNVPTQPAPFTSIAICSRMRRKRCTRWDIPAGLSAVDFSPPWPDAECRHWCPWVRRQACSMLVWMFRSHARRCASWTQRAKWSASSPWRARRRRSQRPSGHSGGRSSGSAWKLVSTLPGSRGGCSKPSCRWSSSMRPTPQPRSRRGSATRPTRTTLAASPT